MLYLIATLAKINFIVKDWRFKEPFVECVQRDGTKVWLNPNFIESVVEVTEEQAETVLSGKRLVGVKTKFEA